MKKRYAFLLGFLFIQIVGFSQNNNHFRSINRQDGLTNNFVKAIHQDGYGYLWIGTKNGLNRYDGVQINQYKSIKDDVYSLNANYINDILYTSKGKLLIANGFGLNEFNYRTEDFSKIEQLNSTNVSRIIEDKNRNIWIKTGSHLILKFNEDLTRIEDFSFAELLKEKFDVTTSKIRVLKYDNENFIIYIMGKGFYLFNFNSHEFKLISNHVFSKLPILNRILKIDDSEFWVATLSGIFVFKNNDLIHHFKHGNSTKDLNSPFVQDMQKMNSHEIWAFTDGGGINVYNLKTKRFKYLKQNARDEFSINSNFLYSSYIAKDSTLWVGSVKNGVSQLTKNNPFVTYKLRDLKDGIRSDHPVSSLFLDREDRIWIGSDGNGLYQFKKGRVQHVYSDEHIKTIPSINEYFPDFLLLGTYKNGVHTFDVKSKIASKQAILHQSIDSSFKVSNILTDVEGNMIIGSSKTIMIDKITQDPTKLLKPNKAIISNNVSCSFIDKEKNLTLLGGNAGLFKFNKNELELITNIPIGIRSIKYYKDNLYWLATNKGVCLVNIKTKKTTFYATESGLNTVPINSMVKSNSNNLWIGNTLGISKFDVTSRKFTNYTYRNGFLDNEFINPAAVKSTNGRLFFGGLKGILAFDPKEIKETEVAKKVVFTNLLVNHKQLERSELKESDKYIANVDALIFDHTQKVLTIDYSTFEFSYPEKIEFSYKLEGYDSEWRITSSRSLTYMNLPVGTYYLQVKATNTLGDFDSNYTTLKLIVLQAWWKTIWFRIFVIIVVLIGLYFSIGFYFKREKIRRNHEFEKKSLKDQQVLDEKQLQFFTNLSHEIRTPLSLIISPIRSIMSSEVFKPDNAKNLNLIEKNALRIERLINRGIDFRKTQFKEPELQAVKLDIISFSKELVESFKGLSTVKNIKLQFVSSVENQLVWFDTYMVETIFYNLLSNAFKYSYENSEIIFSITTKETEIIVSIEDFGAGIPNEDTMHIFERFFQSKSHIGGSGIGLALTKSFVEAHKGTISVKSEKGKGTCFTVILPFGEDSTYKELSETYSNIRTIKPTYIDATEKIKNLDIQFKNKTILVVEDEENLRDYLKTNLSYNYNVKAVANGKLAYEIIRSNNFDLIISDIMMPEMDGIELCKLLKENIETSAIPVILLSAKTLDEDKIKGYDTGADAYIEKPFQLELLKSQVSNLLNRQVRRKTELLDVLGVSKNTETISNSDEKFYAQIMGVIEKNIGNFDFDIPLFALEIGMSKSLLYKRMKEISDVSINDLILTVRLNKAAQLLIHSKESIVDIASSVGFKNAKYFSTSFKKKFKSTPTLYRTKNVKIKNRVSD